MASSELQPIPEFPMPGSPTSGMAPRTEPVLPLGGQMPLPPPPARASGGTPGPMISPAAFSPGLLFTESTTPVAPLTPPTAAQVPTVPSLFPGQPSPTAAAASASSPVAPATAPVAPASVHAGRDLSSRGDGRPLGEADSLIDAPWLQAPAPAQLSTQEVASWRSSREASDEASARQSAGRGGASSPRLASLDIFRGLAMLLMAAELLELGKVAQNTVGQAGHQVWSFLAEQQTHVEWAGCVTHDLIQPAFSFMVGTALAFSMAKRSSLGQSFVRQFLHAVFRGLVLVLLGVFLRSIGGGQTNWTFEDTLSQIGLGYPVLFLLGFAPQALRWTAFVVLLVGYWAAFVYGPVTPAVGSWPQHFQGFFSHWNLNANVAWEFDKWFLNLFPRESPFLGNEGGYSTLSFIPTLATMVLGLITGQWLTSAERSAQGRQPIKARGNVISALVLTGVLCLIAGWASHMYGICPVVKRLWTPSWVLFSGGACCLLLGFFYFFADTLGWKKLFYPLTVIGANSLFMYVAAHTLVGFVQSAFKTHAGVHVFGIFGSAYEPLVAGGAVLLILWLTLVWMYRKGWLIRV